VEDKLYILQARGITSLFPVPQVSFDPLIVWFSFGAVQGLLGPLTPLGQDGILHLVIGGGTMFHVTLKYGEMNVFVLAGERIWIKVSDLLRHPIGARIYKGILPFIRTKRVADPGSIGR
jgi:pyruvate,water dikinase